MRRDVGLGEEGARARGEEQGREGGRRSGISQEGDELCQSEGAEVSRGRPGQWSG